MNRSYQYGFSRTSGSMYDAASRERKAKTMVAVLEDFFPAGLAGFRALGACRLFSLEVAMTPGQEAANARRAADRAASSAVEKRAWPAAPWAGRWASARRSAH